MRIVVTDLTRFSNTQYVCLAGIDVLSGQCIRPMRPGVRHPEYLTYESVIRRGVRPGTCLEADSALVPQIRAPHYEDRLATNIAVAGSVTSDEFERILDASAVSSVRAGFGCRPENRLFAVNANLGCSIFTLKLTNPRSQFSIVGDRYNENKFKAHITDGEGFRLSWVPVADLGFSNHICRVRREDPLFSQLNLFIARQRTVFLRLGLSREHTVADGRNGNWVQLNGIYTFPNYREDLRVYE